MTDNCALPRQKQAWLGTEAIQGSDGVFLSWLGRTTLEGSRRNSLIVPQAPAQTMVFNNLFHCSGWSRLVCWRFVYKLQILCLEKHITIFNSPRVTESQNNLDWMGPLKVTSSNFSAMRRDKKKKQHKIRSHLKKESITSCLDWLISCRGFGISEFSRADI